MKKKPAKPGSNSGQPPNHPFVLDDYLRGFVHSVSFGKQPASKRRSKIHNLLTNLNSYHLKLTTEQLAVIWKGVYYAIWYSEMGKGCEEIIRTSAEEASRDVLVAGFEALAREWFGADQYRLDKLAFLARQLLRRVMAEQVNDLARGGLEADREETKSSEEKTKSGEEAKKVKAKDLYDQLIVSTARTGCNKLDKNARLKIGEVMPRRLIDVVLMVSHASLGLSIHLADIYLDELGFAMAKKKSNERKQILIEMIKPMIKIVGLAEDQRLIDSVKREVFSRFKKESLLNEPVASRFEILDQIRSSCFTIGGFGEVKRRNRNALYSMVEEINAKLEQKSDSEKAVKKRKVLLYRGKRRRMEVKTEVVAKTPFPVSRVPVAVV